ncbi:MAG: translation initiation factor IF-2 [Pirellulales bacterium]|nr:translation initiation factor IF-2 [Pirellulales bacterium]
MPIRIYALAKELKLDNKILVDLCTRAGITGKGSALASLSDEEADKLKAFLSASQGPKTGRKAGAAGRGGEAGYSGALRREDYIAPAGSFGGKIRVLPPKQDKPAALRRRVEESLPAEPPAAPPTEPPAESVVTSAEAPAEPVVGSLHPTEAPAEKRPEDYRLPEATKRSKIPSLTERPSRAGGEKAKEKEKERKEREPRGPTIKLAPLPPSGKKPSRAKPAEPAPQRPDIRLPKDAIRAGKAGAKPLQEHIRKAEEKRRAEERRRTEGGKAKGKPGEAPSPTPARDRRRPSRGVAAPPREEDGLVALGGREQRQLKRKRVATAKRRRESDEEEGTPQPAVVRKKTRIRRTGANTAAPRKESIVVQLPCTVRSFSEALGVPARMILAKLMEWGTLTTIAAGLDPEMAELLAAEFGANVKFHRPLDLESKLLPDWDAPDDPAMLKPRPPIVAFLGHVDHGKTSLLDRILGIDVTSQEKGGITQHIRAYLVKKDDQAIAFVDTPGHEAFTEMRARGANVTDLVVLVVAADDGVMPQTEEAISHARAAGVPIVVALNKIDLPGANPQRAYEQLAANELLPSEWGGETEVIKTSAVTGEGIDNLLETLLTVAELQEYKANPDRPARGTCLEAELSEGRGVVVKLLVRDGTLRSGDVLVCGPAYGRVKAMYDTLDSRRRHDEAGPSTPVNVTGLSVAPGAGDRFYVLEDIAQARHLADERTTAARRRELTGAIQHVTLENLYDRLGHDENVQTLNVILRADVRGSIEAIRKEFSKLEHPEVEIRVLQATVGGITEADVHLAHASDAVIIGFNVVPDEKARGLAEDLGVQIRRYDIIYQVTDDLKKALEGMLKPEQYEQELGRALVLQTFHISKVGTVAGCRVLSGVLARDARIRLIRENRILGDYPVDTLRREKSDAREVREGLECGLKLSGFNDIKEGDTLEAYRIEEVARTL